MSKNILIISTSPRFNSNSDMIANEFERGARDSGNKVEKISLRDKKINFCQGCLACVNSNKCVIKDDANEIVEKMKKADVLVFSTPIYYYEMSGQMKTMLDRANPLYGSDYSFRDVYFIATAAEDGDYVWTRAVCGLEGWIECFEKAKLSGVIVGGGVSAPNEILGHDVLNKAYEMGKEIK